MNNRNQLAALGQSAAHTIAQATPDAVAALAAVLRSQGVPWPVVAAVADQLAAHLPGWIESAAAVQITAPAVVVEGVEVED